MTGANSQRAADEVMVIEPGGRNFINSLLETWRYRELFLFLVWRDISVKYKQTALGFSWAVFQPLVSVLVFTVVFGRMVGVSSDNLPYPLFVIAGIIPWTFFAGALSRSGESLVSSSQLITKIYFPRLIIPAAAASALLLDFVISLLVLMAVMVYYNHMPGVEILAVPALSILMLALAVSFGLFFSALNVRYRDVKFVLTFLVQIWMYVTPIVYPYSLIPDKYKIVVLLNPMIGVVEGFRWAMLGKPFPAVPLAFSILISVLLFVVGESYFRNAERSFADVV